MKTAFFMGAFILSILGLFAPGSANSAGVSTMRYETFVSRDFLAYGFAVSSLQGRNEIDPYTAITLKAVGLGARISKVELSDDKGAVLFETTNQSDLTLPTPLAFETRYKMKVTTERDWTGQQQTHELDFATATVPKLEGSSNRLLEADGSVNLSFDRPVSQLQIESDLALNVKPDTSGRHIRLLASSYQQDHCYPVQLNFKTVTGIALPPLRLEIQTPPALAVDTNVRGLTDLGLMLPVQLTFSEPLLDRKNAPDRLQVQTADGKPITGKWNWTGTRQLKFTPRPDWPASSTVNIIADMQNLRSERGGMLKQANIEQFKTGPDRKLFVYLDDQRVEAVENGKVVRTFKVSTGKSKTPTVTGSYYIYDRYRRKTMRSDVERGQRGFYEVKDVPYTQFFYKDYAFHGAFWHNNFGRPASHGCVNMATKDQNKRWPNVSEDAGWLYHWGALGLPVTVLQKSPQQKQAEKLQEKDGKEVKSNQKAEPPEIAAR